MSFLNTFLKYFYWTLIGILAIILVYTTIEFFILVIKTMINSSSIFDFSQANVKTDNLFIVHVQGLVAGVLLITIIIELIQSLLIYLKTSQHALHLTILYQIALIAVIRHLFIIDFEHVNGESILGLALLIFVLGILSFVNRPKIIQRIINTKKDAA